MAQRGVLRQPQDLGRLALIAIALVAVVVGLSAFSGDLASIFSGSNESGEDPQQGPAQVATATLEPTAMPTVTNTPTQEPTPTATPSVVDELRLSGFETILPLIQEAEPEAYVEAAACANQDEEECVVTVDFCPEGQDCPHILLITNQYLANVAFYGNEAQALEEMKSYASRRPNGMFDSERVFKIVEYTRLCSLETATGVLLTPELQTELNSVFGTPTERSPWRIAAFPITEAALKELLVSGLESIGPYGDSESCP
jgi:hypothetical protein